MKIVYLVILSTLLFCSCKEETKKTSVNVILLKTFDGEYSMFLLKEDIADIGLFNIRKYLLPGIIIPKTSLVKINFDSAVEIKLPNTYRHIEIYGDIDKFNYLYFAKLKSSGFRIDNEEVQYFNFSKFLNLDSLPIKNSTVDSIVIDFNLR
jgi:hypothetical protein